MGIQRFPSLLVHLSKMNQMQDKIKPKFQITPAATHAFAGKKKHDEVLDALLKKIVKINFRDFLKMEEAPKQKHIIVGVVQNLLEVATANKWNLCKKYDYVYVYNGEYWAQCSRDEIKAFLGNAAIRMGCAEYNARHFDFKEKLLKQFLSDSHLSESPKQENKTLINLQNGTMEFSDSGWRLREFNPKDFITYQLPFAYDQDAVCPLFDSYLQHVLPENDSRLILQEFCGYVFSKMNLEKCLVLLGPGQNGKSVFFNVLTALLGEENTLTYSLGLFGHEYHRARLTNVLLNYSSERGTDLQPDIFKALVSGEPQQAREPYGKSFTLKNKVRFIINANDLPKETDQTEAYFRRFLIVPFDVKISEAEKDIYLAEKIIKTELAGVFIWVLNGLERVTTQEKFSESPKAKEALTNFRKQSDSVALFVDEFTYVQAKRKEALSDIYLKYKHFCLDDGYKPVGKNKFSGRLENKGFERARLSNGSAAFLIEREINK